MLFKVIFFCFAITCVTSQDQANDEVCGSPTTINQYFSKDAYPLTGPPIQPESDVLQGRPGKAGPRGFKGDKGVQGEACVPDYSVIESLKNELTNLTTQLVDLKTRLENLTVQNRNNIPLRVPTRTDCNNNVTTSGVYRININQRFYNVSCEVERSGGNWLVFQQRIDGSVDFYRNWTEYQQGFGNAYGSYWLGLDAIHAISNSGSYQLRVDLEDWSRNTAYALYSSFSVGDESSNYLLSVSGYSGTAGDSLGPQNNQQFSTFDRDNDMWNRNCAVSFHGAWWYNQCHSSNLNGKYQRGLDNTISNRWSSWRRSQSLKRSVMKIRPN